MGAKVSARPILETGNNMDRDTFIRVWEQLPNVKRAELIGGIVYMPSPLSTDHGDLDFNVVGWLAYYKAMTPGCAGGSNTTSYILDDSPQPDVNLRIATECGGKSWVENKYLHGAPELLVEVCNTTESMDLHQKFDLYEEAGVQEYLVVVVQKRQLRWHRLVREKYKLIRPDTGAIYRSRIFPGLWLDSKALFKDDMAKVLAKLQEGIASPEHQRFVAELASRKQRARP